MGTMAKPKPVWEVFKGRYSAGGDRNVLIVTSIGEVNIDSPDVVPRSAVELTEDNRRKLTNQGVPEECCDDLSIIKARINLDKTYHLVGTEVSEPGNELSRSYILGRIADLMKQNNKPGGEFYEISVCSVCSLTCLLLCCLSQSSFTTLVMERKTQVTGASKMAASPLRTSLNYTMNFARVMSLLLSVTAATLATG